MVVLSEYSESSRPQVGSVSGKEYCKDTSRYEPYEIKNDGAILAGLEDMCVSLGTASIKIMSRTKQLEEDLGPKFVRIDNRGLTMVEEYEITSNIYGAFSAMEAQRDRAKSLVEDIKGRTEKIKSYLKKLDSNYKELERLKSRRESCLNSINNLSHLISQEKANPTPNESLINIYNEKVENMTKEATSLGLEMNEYKEIEPQGQWVLK